MHTLLACEFYKIPKTSLEAEIAAAGLQQTLRMQLVNFTEFSVDIIIIIVGLMHAAWGLHESTISSNDEHLIGLRYSRFKTPFFSSYVRRTSFPYTRCEGNHVNKAIISFLSNQLYMHFIIADKENHQIILDSGYDSSFLSSDSFSDLRPENFMLFYYAWKQWLHYYYYYYCFLMLFIDICFKVEIESINIFLTQRSYLCVIALHGCPWSINWIHHKIIYDFLPTFCQSCPKLPDSGEFS